MKRNLFKVCMMSALFIGSMVSSCDKPCEHVEAIIEGKEATCTEAGLTEGKYCSVCEEILLEQQVIEPGHTPTVLEGVAATCTTDGFTEGSKCSVCNEILVAQEVIEKTGHYDDPNDDDIICDHEGCTQKIGPKADSTLSLTVANAMKDLSVSASYYVEGEVIEEGYDSKNGIFNIKDEKGVTFYLRIVKDADGLGHSQWAQKIVVGDYIKAYGKITKFTSVTPNIAHMQGAVVTILNHEHVYGAATCTEGPTCLCGHVNGEPNGHTSLDGDRICDVCSFDMDAKVSELKLFNETALATGSTTATWENDYFTATVAKGTGSNIYVSANDHMRLYKNNTISIGSKNGEKIQKITILTSSTTYAGHWNTIFTSAGYTPVVDGNNVTITVDSAEELFFTNTTTSTTRLSGIEFIYK